VAELLVSLLMKLETEPELDLEEALWLAVVSVFTTKLAPLLPFCSGFIISIDSNWLRRFLY
jgi:hypothetical protein